MAFLARTLQDRLSEYEVFPQPTYLIVSLLVMKNPIESIIADIQKGLARAAMDYANVGLNLYHSSKKLGPMKIQLTIGNLAISVELMIKTYLFKQDPTLIYKNLPLELQIALKVPGKMPTKFPWKVHETELKGSGHKTIELTDCINCFAILFPDEKQQLGAHLRFLARARNVAVHSVLPAFQQYELDRSIYVMLSMHEVLTKNDGKMFHYFKLDQNDKNKAFLKTFDELRINRVHKVIEGAKKKAKTLGTTRAPLVVTDWNFMATECPICGNDALLVGDTQHEVIELDPEGFGEHDLAFAAESFECESCGLKLEDTKELELAGIETTLDRSAELDRWFGEQAYEPSWEDYEDMSEDEDDGQNVTHPQQ